MITFSAFLQVGLFILALIICTKPLGLYLSKVLNPHETTFLDPVIKPIESFTYKLLHIDSQKEQTWVEYLFSLLWFSFASLAVTMFILFLQPYLPLNPQGLPPLSWHLLVNTAVSFMTNTNWQSYAGETTMSYFSQMAALTVQNFASPAVGIAASATLVRALTRNKTETVGNFWVDLFRICYYLLLPLSVIFAIIFLSEGVPQNFSDAVQAQTVEGSSQIIAQGPVASQEAIKLLGSNGGGFFNANSAHPYENPSPFSNFIQMLAILLIPAAQIYYLGNESKDKKHAWSVIATITILFIVGAWICIWSETTRTPLLTNLGLYGGNMEGKEQRFGSIATAFYSSLTTDSSCGAVNGSLDSMTPLGSVIPMINMLFSESIFGGCGSGLYSILIYVFIAIFFAGLIIGRTPEYLGKKIEAPEIKLTIIALLVFGFTILSLTAWTVIRPWGLQGIENKGVHGFSEILYAYISTAANNGSAFSGLSSNSYMYNLTLSIAMLAGRFGLIIPVLALAGSLAGKNKAPHTPNNLVVHGVIFTVFLLMIFLLFGALMFLPTLAMGPIFEEFYMYMGTLF